MSRSSTLGNRLLPPRLPPYGLPRDVLVAQVVDGLSARLVVVTGGAGYGKSTLVAQALSRCKNGFVWLTLDARVARPESLLAHLSEGIAARIPGFGARLASVGSPLERARALCREVVSTVADDLVVVLDDVHHLREPDAVEALDVLLYDLPSNVHIALTSRARLPFAVDRLRPLGVVEIGEADLALSREETATLLGKGADHPDVVALHEMSEGWLMGVLIASRSPAPLVRVGEGPAGRRLFDYLAEQVLDRQPADIQEFLVATSALDRFTPALASAVTGRVDAADVLATIVTDHLFAVGEGTQGEWYRYHAVFRALLRRRFEERHPGWRVAVHRRAAEAWVAAGEPQEAARHFLLAGEPAAVVDTLEPVAERMMAGAEGGSVASWLATVPPEMWADSPGLVLAQASALFARAQFPQALDAVERAVEWLVAAGEHDRAAIAFFRYLRALGLAGGQQQRSIAAADRYLPRLGPGARALPAVRLALAQAYSERGRYDEAADQLRGAVAGAAPDDAPVVSAYAEATRAFAIDHPQGRSEAALAALDRSIALLERWRDEDRLYFLPFARARRAMVLNDVGRFEDALAEVERLQESCDTRGLSQFAAPVLAWLRFDALAGMGRWSELGAELAAQAPLFARMGNVARGYAFHVATARLAAENRDAATVAARVDSARSGLRAAGHPFDEAMALGDLALAAWEVGLVEQARVLAHEARDIADTVQAPWPRAKAALAGALAHGPGAEGDALLSEALDLTERHSLLGLWTRGGRRVASRPLARAIARGLGPDGMAARLAVAAGGEVLDRAAELLVEAAPAARARLVEAAGSAPGTEAAVERLGGRRGAAPESGHRDRPPLRFATLGGFVLWRDGVRVSDAEFARQKARPLLAMLLCAQAAVHREVLVEALWPDLPPERGVAALTTTVYSLRRALEPGLGRGTPPTVLVTDGPTYRLALGPQDDWDARRFLDLVREATTAVPTDLDALLAAEALYAGPFLQEWLYDDWTAPLRAEVEESFLAVLARLAEALSASGQPGAAISRYRRLLAKEPEREGWHRALMRVYAQAGERALALRQYQECRALLRNRLGIEPSKETRALYAELLREDGESPP